MTTNASTQQTPSIEDSQGAIAPRVVFGRVADKKSAGDGGARWVVRRGGRVELGVGGGGVETDAVQSWYVEKRCRVRHSSIGSNMSGDVDNDKSLLISDITVL